MASQKSSSDSLPRYIIGIDLGTTNSALSWIDTQSEAPHVHTLPIPQLVDYGQVSEALSLPSFLLLPDMSTIKPDALSLPWTKDSDLAVGTLARAKAHLLPGATVSSAKSWLIAAQIDPTSPCLPPDETAARRISPLEASTFYLRHLVQAWNKRMAATDPDAMFHLQQIVLTVPASFNTVARELTFQAAQAAGFTPTLLEEPQAAFYNWLHAQGDAWRKHLNAGDTILVVDIGGGTTDFSLVGVENQAGDLALTRLAVGEHLLLGGDNLDYSLAFAAQKKLATRLTPRQLAALVHSCRAAKEQLLGPNPPAEVSLSILGSGSGLIGGSLKTALSRAEADELILQGFFPDCPLAELERPLARSGLRTVGLNFEAEPAVSRHLASFLVRNCPRAPDGSLRLPTALLLNGGVTKAPRIAERIAELLASWGAQDLRLLTDSDPDLAVSRGAAFSGLLRRGRSIRIKAGAAMSYYIGVESSMPAVPGFEAPLDAVCVLPFGTEDGSSFSIPVQGLALIVGEDSRFRFFAASDRHADKLGQRIEDAEGAGLTELPALHKSLSHADAATGTAVIPVTLEATYTEIGTIELQARSRATGTAWRLEFDLAAGKN